MNKEASEMEIKWQEFSYDSHLEQGVYWFVLSSTDCSTGKTTERVVLGDFYWVGTEPYDHPEFIPEISMVDDDRSISDDEVITHYAIIEKPPLPLQDEASHE